MCTSFWIYLTHEVYFKRYCKCGCMKKQNKQNLQIEIQRIDKNTVELIVDHSYFVLAKIIKGSVGNVLGVGALSTAGTTLNEQATSYNTII